MKTFCANHGLEVPEGDFCKQCLISLPEERAIAIKLFAAINQGLAGGQPEKPEAACTCPCHQGDPPCSRCFERSCAIVEILEEYEERKRQDTIA